MPQAIQPGSFMNRYTQTLLQSIVMQSFQMLQNGLAGGLGALGGNLLGTNPNFVLQMDSMLTSTMVSLDAQLASVGVGLGPTNQAAQQGQIPGLPNPNLIPRPQLTPGDIRPGAAGLGGVGIPGVQASILPQTAGLPAAGVGAAAAQPRAVTADIGGVGGALSALA